MGMAIDAGEGPKSEPNVVPMIDIMLVLLIIFMIVTPVITAGFQAQMPQGRNVTGREESEGDITLGVDKDGHYFLDAGTGEVHPVCPLRVTGCVERDKLGEFLTQIYTNRAKDKILYFKADQNLEYSKVEGAIEIARKAGVRVMAAITEEKRAQQPLLGR